VLRLSRERLIVWLGPAEVRWLKLRGGLQPTVLDKGGARADSAYGPQPWQGAIAALRERAEGWSRDRLSVTIVLSNHFVRYALVPPSDNVSGAEEESALARFYFSKVHGERSGAWDVRLSNMHSNGPKPVCAIDAGLLPALRACFPQTGRPRLVSVQPLLMSAFNRWRRRFPAAGAWFLLIEPERACLALLAGRTWVMVRNVKGDYPDAEAWVSLLDRERWSVAAERTPDTVLVHAPRLPGMPLTDHGTWRLLGLQAAWPEGLSPLEDSCYAVALTAA
jgi:hypothetical protein